MTMFRVSCVSFNRRLHELINCIHYLYYDCIGIKRWILAGNSAMMGVRKDYKRWDYDDETEITMEEQLTLEENPDSSSLGGGADSLNSSNFPPPNIVLSSSPIRNREMKRSRKVTMREKVS